MEAKCGICMDKEATLIHQVTGCGGSFCSMCLSSALSTGAMCPHCQGSLANDDAIGSMSRSWLPQEEMVGFTTMCGLCCSGEEAPHIHPWDPLELCGISSLDEWKYDIGNGDITFKLAKPRRQLPDDKVWDYSSEPVPWLSGQNKLFVKALDGLKIQLQCDFDKVTVEGLKACLSHHLGFCKEGLRLILRGTPLFGDRLLSSLGTRDGDTIHVVLEMRGS